MAIIKLDFLFIASETYLFPSNLLPLIAKKASFFFIDFELIQIFLIIILLDIFDLDSSFIIFNFISFDKNLFLYFIDFKITFLSEKNSFLFPKS